MIQDAAAVIVGAGALGASVAFHLAKAGQPRIALIDKHDLASQTSPRAAGLTAQVRTTDIMTRLAMMAVKKIERFEAETGEPLVYHQSGSMKIARTPEHRAQLEREVARGRRLGLEIDLTPFRERAAAYPPLAELAEQLAGMRPPRFPSLFETLMSTHRRSWRSAAKSTWTTRTFSASTRNSWPRAKRRMPMRAI